MVALRCVKSYRILGADYEAGTIYEVDLETAERLMAVTVQIGMTHYTLFEVLPPESDSSSSAAPASAATPEELMARIAGMNNQELREEAERLGLRPARNWNRTQLLAALIGASETPAPATAVPAAATQQE